MGNGVGKLSLCFAGVSAGDISQRRHDIAIYLSNPLDEGFGHSFCYFRPDPSGLLPKDFTTATATATAMFKSISGASLSANTSTPLSTAPVDLCPSIDKASSFESSHSFASIPLQPVPRNSIPSVRSGPIPRTSGAALGSGPMERGFKSGPIERSYISISGPLENQFDQLQRYKPNNSKKWALMKNLKRVIRNSIVRPIRGVSPTTTAEVSDWTNENGLASSDDNLTSADESSEESSFECPNVQWAQGKAGEDRVHIVISEEHGWVFVGIYDGFNGPDATDFLLNNLYSNLHKELEGIVWKDKSENEVIDDQVLDICSDWSDKENYPTNENSGSRRKRRRKSNNSAKKWDREILENSRNDHEAGVKHSDVLKALSEALRKTEESYLEIADLMLKESPELSMMGSCVLGMLMKGEDVYLMNVGDSRAVLGRRAEPDLGDLERINEESLNDFEEFDDGKEFGDLPKLTSLQLTMDHSTSVEEEVKRVKKEHLDDASAITNNRVKGSLKVTRAFGAGFLKKPKWNNAVLKMLRIDYVGNSPYINCLPSLYHHRLSQRDRFLILSSDGLYQYFTNKEAVSEVEIFISSFPEGDPAQHLVEEVLFRAAKKAGMDFHELLDIPQGERRKYHDDVSIIIISFEGRIWRSSV